jgi:hypothetical protein
VKKKFGVTVVHAVRWETTDIEAETEEEAAMIAKLAFVDQNVLGKKGPIHFGDFSAKLYVLFLDELKEDGVLYKNSSTEEYEDEEVWEVHPSSPRAIRRIVDAKK